MAIVVGGGNFFRGAELSQRGMDRARADYMGMLGTVMNCLALQDFLEKAGVATRVQTAITMGQVAEPYIPRRAVRHLEKGRVVIFGAGAGLPYFSTDTVAAQRALEIGCEVLLMGKNGVDGVYDADPRRDPDAASSTRSPTTRCSSAASRSPTRRPFSLCRDNGMPIVVFGLDRRQHRPGRPRREDRHAGARRRLERGDSAAVIDETLFEAEEKMEKAVHVARDDLAGLRTGRANAERLRPHRRRLLRRADADPAAGLRQRPGGADGRHQALRRQPAAARSRRRSATATSASTRPTTARSSGSCSPS